MFSLICVFGAVVLQRERSSHPKERVLPDGDAPNNSTDIDSTVEMSAPLRAEVFGKAHLGSSRVPEVLAPTHLYRLPRVVLMPTRHSSGTC